MKQSRRDELWKLVAILTIWVGCIVAVHGVWLAWRPGGWMVAGVLIALPALFLLRDLLGDGIGCS